MLFKGCLITGCLNRGSCLYDEKKQTFSCLCTPPWTGEKCEIDMKCSSSPCQNGATCNDHSNGFSCSCVAGFEGRHCENDVNECSSSPCKNGATCNDHSNGYSCTCVAGFEGSHCENVDVCHGYQTLTSADRKNTYVSQLPYLCDSTLDGWYRFQGDAGTLMATTCPSQYRCGVIEPYWLQTPHPTVADGETTASVCYHANGDCCDHGRQIKVKNCGSYYVYNFYASLGCPFRYCGSD
ncbi:hypothetical protein ACROYT_G030829 [Oculina patagonica]